VLGGALLSFAVVAKSFPVLLLLHLSFRRKWEALLWTFVFGVVQVGVAMHVLGTAPFTAFAHEQLPRLIHGVGLPVLGLPEYVAVNQAVAGVVLKLQLLGLPPPIQEPRFFALVSWLFAGVMLAATWSSRRVSTEPHRQTLVWLSLLLGGSLLGPWVEQSQGLLPVALLPVLVVVATGWKHPAVILAVLVWLGANAMIPPDPTVSPALLTAVTLAQQALGLGLAAWALRRGLAGALSRALGVAGRTPSPEPARTYRRW
jgi:hypothetical protein